MVITDDGMEITAPGELRMRARAGDAPAFCQLIEPLQPRLLRQAVALTGDVSAAEDLVSETLVEAWKSLARYDESCRFSTWLYAIAGNLVRDRYRWRKRHPQVSLDAPNEPGGNDFAESLPDAAPSASQTAQGNERAEAVRRAVAALPEQLRVPLILSEYEEKSHAEIGQILQCSAKAVEVRIYRARRQLRESLAPLLETT